MPLSESQSPRSCAGVLWLLSPLEEIQQQQSRLERNKPMSKATVTKLKRISEMVLKDHECPSWPHLHAQSLQGDIDYTRWSNSEFVQTHRQKVIAWLFPRCAGLGFHDRWATGALMLLDRFASSESEAALNWMPWDAFWHTMAAMLLSMKMCEAESNSGMSYKRMLTKLAFPSRHEQWWDEVRGAECSIIVALACRLNCPTALDLVEPLAVKMCLTTSSAAAVQWNGSHKGVCKAVHPNMEFPLPRVTLLAMYIVELGLVHAADSILESRVPALAVAIAALELSLYAFGEPPEKCDQELQSLRKQVYSSALDGSTLRQLRKLLLKIWKHPPQASPVAEKWRCRALQLGGAFPEPQPWLPYARFRSLTFGRAWPDAAGGATEDVPEDDGQTRTPDKRTRSRMRHCEATSQKQAPSERREKTQKSWEEVWAGLEKSGWRVERVGKQAYFMPPNVKRREGGARNRVHYFDSKKQVLEYVNRSENLRSQPESQVEESESTFAPESEQSPPSLEDSSEPPAAKRVRT
mmetsp:Transcript_44949/g.106739  ORF Transcript_44949/g.106739 Transcript_44949/m.106739 type:complete len:522 (+) Transcript_44949:86-1651(+)